MPARGAVELHKPVPWYHGLTKEHWKVLLVCNLGWMFDGYETYALVLAAQVALEQILPEAAKSHLHFYQGLLIGMSLLGWAVGGITWGAVADYIGRKRAMMYSILAYSLFTGATAFVSNWETFALFRFLTGLGLGAEWGAGAALLAEKWPEHARTKGAGFMQSGLGIGFFVASLVWLLLNPLGPNAWRYMFLLGVLPALFLLYIRSRIHESEKWEAVHKNRAKALEKARRGETLDQEEANLSRFTLAALFADRTLRRRTILACLMSLTTTVGWWGVSTWIPAYIGNIAKATGLAPAHWAAVAGMVYNAGTILGYISVPFIADAWGRRISWFVFSVVSWVVTLALFLGDLSLSPLLLLVCISGFFTNGQYSFYPVYLPELYPTHLRATAMSFVFNVTRLIAFLGPIVGGTLVGYLGGIPYAAATIGMIYLLGVGVAPFLPETKGQPLPQ